MLAPRTQGDVLSRMMVQAALPHISTLILGNEKFQSVAARVIEAKAYAAEANKRIDDLQAGVAARWEDVFADLREAFSELGLEPLLEAALQTQAQPAELKPDRVDVQPLVSADGPLPTSRPVSSYGKQGG